MSMSSKEFLTNQNYQVFKTKGCACDDCGGVAWVEEELGLGLDCGVLSSTASFGLECGL